jgi:hypothetical protein
MSDRRTETIEIGKGVHYAKVAARSAEFHKDNELCSIETTCEFKEGFVLFTAKVTTKKGTFTGHSMDKVSGRQKQFEKQETIAVGRALAFAGYLASGDIACAEEMADVVTAAQLNSLKLKFAKLNADALAGLDQPHKLERFCAWCLSVVGEQVDYNDPQSWETDWFRQCWRELIGPDADVPFE